MSCIRMTVLAVVVLIGGASKSSAALAQPAEFGLDAITPGLEPTVNINFGSAMMAGFSASVATSNKDMSTLLDSITRLRLMVFEEFTASADFTKRLNVAIDQLTSTGWSQALRVREDGELVDLFVIEDGEIFTAMALVVQEQGEALVLANVRGQIDPALVGKLISEGSFLDGFDF
ncbi:MAG: DUF4252 domain-containing protein [Pseudomonadota bacterium]